MADIVERLRFDAARCEATFSKGVASNIEEAAAEIERLLPFKAEVERLAEALATSEAHKCRLLGEIERLRAALRSCPCPGGGWNGMPEGLEPTVGACADHGTCGCVYGAALHEQTPACPDHPTGRTVNNAGQQICDTCGRS